MGQERKLRRNEEWWRIRTTRRESKEPSKGRLSRKSEQTAPDNTEKDDQMSQDGNKEDTEELNEPFQ